MKFGDGNYVDGKKKYSGEDFYLQTKKRRYKINKDSIFIGLFYISLLVFTGIMGLLTYWTGWQIFIYLPLVIVFIMLLGFVSGMKK